MLDPAPAVPIAIVVADPTGSTGGLYVERALTVAGNGREFDVDVRDGREVADVDARRICRASPRCSCSARARSIAAAARLIRNYLAGGGQVLLAMGPDVDPGTLSDVLGTTLAFDDVAGHGRRARR